MTSAPSTEERRHLLRRKRAARRRLLARAPNGWFSDLLVSTEHLKAVALGEKDDFLAAEVCRKSTKAGGMLALSLFSTLGCHAFGLALFCLFLAGLEAKETCDLIDASA